MLGVESRVGQFGRFGFFFIAVETVGGVAKCYGKSFGHAWGVDFAKRHNINADFLLLLRPFGGFGSGFGATREVSFFGENLELTRTISTALGDNSITIDDVVVNRGGDADTTGAIAGMLSGALYGMRSLPPRWLKALDPDVRAACQRQARALVLGLAGRCDDVRT